MTIEQAWDKGIRRVRRESWDQWMYLELQEVDGKLAAVGRLFDAATAPGGMLIGLWKVDVDGWSAYTGLQETEAGYPTYRGISRSREAA